ncbi:hypothetical protein FRC11_011739, partial [Ceratobasidium sp. 423]
MLDGSSPRKGKVWQKVSLKFLCKGRRNKGDFLVADIGQNQLILGNNWLKEYDPIIDWVEETLQFPELADIATEEDADTNPLKNIPSMYHQFSKVFGEEEFAKLPPHQEFNITIELKDEDKKLNSPLYAMTDSESSELKEWLKKELHDGKCYVSHNNALTEMMLAPKS